MDKGRTSGQRILAARNGCEVATDGPTTTPAVVGLVDGLREMATKLGSYKPRTIGSLINNGKLLRDSADALAALVVALERAEQRAADRTENVKAANARSRILADQTLEAKARAERAEQALKDACDVAVWLSALVPHEGEAWDTWERQMRPKLHAVLAVLAGSPDRDQQ